MATSAAQLAANQQNALLSTGPRTETGKANSSQNAYRNGCYAAKLRFASPEQEALYLTRIDQYVQVYQPASEVELNCVQQIARAAWLSEIRDSEESEYEIYLQGKFAAEPDPADPAKPASIRMIEARATDKTLRSLTRRAGELRQMANRNLKELLRLQAERKAKDAEDEGSSAPHQALAHINPRQAAQLLIAGFDPFVVDALPETDRTYLLNSLDS